MNYCDKAIPPEGPIMMKAQRQRQIVSLLSERRLLSVNELSTELGVSNMTVRRYLNELSTKGIIERFHGGARMPDSASPLLDREYSHLEKRTRNADIKSALAHTAVRLIEEGQTIYLGTGTTVEAMTTLLPDIRLRAVTNSLTVMNLLAERSCYEICFVGGIYRARTAAMVGPLAEEAISSLGIDAAFIGANGVSDGYVSTSNVEEGKLQQLAFDKAKLRYLVVDNSKIGVRDFYSFYRIEDLTAIICDNALANEERADLEARTRVICD